jgi:hypothetical protein
MSIPPVGSSGPQPVQSAENTEQTPVSSQAETPKESAPQSEPLTEAGKGQLVQESKLSGQTMRTQLDTALEKNSSTQTHATKAKEGDVKTDTTAAFPKDASELAKTNNKDLLELAKTPEGEEKLKQLAKDFKKDGLTPDELKQMERIDAATFRPGAGLMLHGKPEDQEKFIQMTRSTMLDSPSFHNRMKTINHDPLHLTEIELTRGEGDLKDKTRIGSFSKFNEGRQRIDLNDLEKLPEKPSPNPESITRGEVIAHELTEARQGAQEFNVPKKREEQDRMFDPAHGEGIKAENEYRKDIGQKSMRKMPPNDVTRLPDANIVHFDDGHDEKLQFEATQKGADKTKLKGTTFIPAKTP